MRHSTCILSGLALIAIGAVAAFAQGVVPPVNAPLAGTAIDPVAIAAAVPNDYLGTYTIAGGLPDPVISAGKRVLASDLGGGPGYLRATNGCWTRVATTTAHVQNVPVAAAVTIDGLSNSPILNLTGSGFSGKANITITNACSMPQVTLVSGASVFGALGSLGLGLAGGTPVTVNGIGTAGTWNDYAISADGSTLTKIRGGSL